jgi:hypothetical protein
LNVDQNLVAYSLNPDKGKRKFRPFIEESLTEDDLVYFDSVTKGDIPEMEMLSDPEWNCYLEQTTMSATVQSGIIFNGKDKRVLITIFQLPYNLLVTSNEEVIERVKRLGVWDNNI